jgi:hypothetical protein
MREEAACLMTPRDAVTGTLALSLRGILAMHLDKKEDAP